MKGKVILKLPTVRADPIEAVQWSNGRIEITDSAGDHIEVTGAMARRLAEGLLHVLGFPGKPRPPLSQVKENR